MNFRKIKFPQDLEYSSDSEDLPLQFYLDVFPVSKEIYLKLGYFSSKAIQVLAYGFAQFIYNGGTIRVISNHFLYENDKELLDLGNEIVTDGGDDPLLHDLKWIHENLNGREQHFFDCLKFLIRNNRLEIIPVVLKPGRMAHYKQGIFEDNENNRVFMDGSCNFTANGLLENGETISVHRSWGDGSEQRKIKSKYQDIQSIAEKRNEKYEYLTKDKVIDAITSIGRDKELKELLEDELGLHSDEPGAPDTMAQKLRSLLRKYEKDLVEKIKLFERTPRFPFSSGPRAYQVEAYNSWVANDKKGIFAMATGTGKTITALNCLLRELEQNGTYQALSWCLVRLCWNNGGRN